MSADVKVYSPLSRLFAGDGLLEDWPELYAAITSWGEVTKIPDCSGILGEI